MHPPVTDGTPGAASTNRGPRRGARALRGAVAALATIPLCAGLFNALTNKLAVTMMFFPIRRRGLG